MNTTERKGLKNGDIITHNGCRYVFREYVTDFMLKSDAAIIENPDTGKRFAVDVYIILTEFNKTKE